METRDEDSVTIQVSEVRRRYAPDEIRCADADRIRDDYVSEGERFR